MVSFSYKKPIQQKKDEFKGPLFFSYGKSNSCEVLNDFIGNKPFNVKNRISDDSGRILILEVNIDVC